MNPSSWNPDMDVVAAVGLGHGSKEQQIMGTQMILANQEKIVAAFKGFNPLVQPKHVRKTLEKQTEAIGFRNVAAFYGDPTDEEMAAFMQAQAQAQGGNPLAEAEAVKAQGEMQKEMLKQQSAMQQATMEHEREMMEIVLKDQRERMVMGLEWNEAEAERAMKVSIEMAKHYREGAKTLLDHEADVMDHKAKMAGVLAQRASAHESNQAKSRPSAGKA